MIELLVAKFGSDSAVCICLGPNGPTFSVSMASLCSLVTSKNIGQAVASNCPMLEQLAVTLPESDTDAALKASFLLSVFRSYCS